ncbi:MAG TPA: type II toxin-antitoxin system death-on-curing family toxin [Xanthobacteraceae bacterium]|nr:type II toxin-antitoxin system death-on-curing family toxin [Xanthobacteraceae bacterium]
MSGPRWLTIDEALVIHERQLGRFGGAAGLRDRGMLESALSRPVNKWEYEGADLVDLAAAYAFGVARNHPFVDGNKRVAFLTMAAFLRLNGLHFAPSQKAATAAMLALASGEIDEAGLARWIMDNVSPVRGR